jgi:hypothetical protein
VETHATLRRVLALDPEDGLDLYHCACARALLGEAGPALQLLHQAFESGSRGVIHAARADSAFSLLSDDPAFLRLLTELE